MSQFVTSSGVSSAMRAAILVLLLTTPAFGQSPGDLDAECSDHSVPSLPSYEPPPWIGDAPPTHSTAAAAAATVQALLPQRSYGTAQPVLWGQLADAYRDQCLLGDAIPHSCWSAVQYYHQVVTVQLRTPSKAFPPGDRMLFRIAVVVRHRARIDDARTTLERLLRFFPLSSLKPSALILLGQTYEHEGNLAAARDYYEQAAEEPSNEQALALYLAAWAARVTGDDADASRYAAQALATATGPLEAGLRRDWCALRAGAD